MTKAKSAGAKNPKALPAGEAASKSAGARAAKASKPAAGVAIAIAPPAAIAGLEWVGPATKPEEDADAAISKAIVARFPKGSFARLGRATDGTWFAIVEEGHAGPGKGRQATPLYRIHWIEGDVARASDAPRVLKGDPSFDRETGTIWVTADNADVVAFDLVTGRARPVDTRALVHASRPTILGEIHALRGGRVLVEVTLEEPFERALVVAACEGDALVPLYQAAFFGDFAVLDRSIVVGGARQVFALGVGADAFRVLLHVPTLSSRKARVIGGRARFYSNSGAWELAADVVQRAEGDAGAWPVFAGFTGRTPSA
jgi:hypothetical protein